MTETPNGGAQALPVPVRPPFPLERLLFALGFAIIAWFVLWILFFVGLIQFAVVAVNGHANDELKRFSLSLVRYVGQLLDFVTFGREERPFPFGPYPRAG
ncbi:MAG TPA: DUF4389 domain-containing protein [Rhizomicrobium sp.]|nr:DUF4389 domain-containing protein [Rhizomicrobium sp.]